MVALTKVLPTCRSPMLGVGEDVDVVIGVTG
jgi:hypothetical protein